MGLVADDVAERIKDAPPLSPRQFAALAAILQPPAVEEPVVKRRTRPTRRAS